MHNPETVPNIYSKSIIQVTGEKALFVNPQCKFIIISLLPYDINKNSHPLHRRLQEGRVRLPSQIPLRPHCSLPGSSDASEMASWNCGRLGRKSTLPTYSTRTNSNEYRTALLPTLPSSTGKTARDDTMRESLRRQKRHMRRRLRVSRTASTVSTNEVHDGSGTGLDMIYSTEQKLSRLLSTVCTRPGHFY